MYIHTNIYIYIYIYSIMESAPGLLRRRAELQPAPDGDAYIRSVFNISCLFFAA